MTKKIAQYTDLLGLIKQRIRQGQTQAVFAANAEMIEMYWDIGRLLHERQQKKGWGASIIPRLSRDIRNELPEVKGFSERNIGRMIAFYRAYPALDNFLPQLVAKLEASPKERQAAPKTTESPKLPQAVAKIDYLENLQQLVEKIPWGHNILLMEKVKNLPERLWHIQQTIEHGWSRSALLLMIKGHAHERQGKAVTNFDKQLPPIQSDLAQQALKDPYIFDFLTMEEPFHERELETGLIHHLEKFLLELGQGFAFLGRQYRKMSAKMTSILTSCFITLNCAALW